MNARGKGAVFAFATILVACEATGEIRGGELKFDAAAQPIPTSAFADDDAGAGTTWTDLYRDFFGPTAHASCAGDGSCHGDANQNGALSSGGYVCGDKDGCRLSMTGTAGLVSPTDAKSPEASALVLVLRKRDDNGNVTGTMPQSPTYVFSPASIARIETWIRNGAPND